MAEENVQLDVGNFCSSPIQSDQFCNIYGSAGLDYMKIVNSTGTNFGLVYTLDNSIGEVVSLEYTGPRNMGLAQSQLGDELPFFTLEHDSNSQCTIREWRLDTTNYELDLFNTITKTTISGATVSGGASYSFDCYSMSVEYYNTTFAQATTTGTGQIKLSDLSEITVGDNLLLGPSNDATNQFAFENVTVTGIAGDWILLDTMYPSNEYQAGDDISYYKHIYLFSDLGIAQNTSVGALYKIHPSTGDIIEVIESGIYSGVRGSAWDPSYQAVAFVRGNNLMYSTISGTYQIERSQVLNNIESNKVTEIPVYDLVFESTSIYRLQQKKTLVSDDGVLSTYSWGSQYNYHQDTIVPYTRSLVMQVSPAAITLNTDTITLTSVVRDQFGVGLSAKLIQFYRAGDTGSFNPADGQATTDVNGRATIQYTMGYHNPEVGGTDDAEVIFDARTDGATNLTGSQYVWDSLISVLKKKYTSELTSVIQKPTLVGAWPGVGSELYTETSLSQIEDYTINILLKSLNKFQFPGGHWTEGRAPTSEVMSINQITDFASGARINQLSGDFETPADLIQDKEVSKDLQLSQVYVSRHVLTGHKDTVDVDQFKFIEDAIPAFWSYKNPTTTYIWIRLRPFAYSLNQSSLIFKVREISYAGDTNYIDVTSQCVVQTFDAGGGLLGLDILYNPSTAFHHNATVYVSIEVHDTAPVSNIIVTDYWFKIIPDFKAPYIVNENPSREEEDVVRDTNISFEIIDDGAGVNINSLELYINNKLVTPSYYATANGYYVEYGPDKDFYYSQSVEVSLKIQDVSDSKNSLYDMWRFYVEGSTGPWIDPSSFYPKNCVKGMPRKISEVSFNVYAINDTGLDRDSIVVHIGGKERDVTITPIIYRLS